MRWKSVMAAGVVLLTGCDMRSDEEISTGLEAHISERCTRENSAAIDALGYCQCLVDRLVQGKSTAELRQMEENPASYEEPPAEIVRECQARHPILR